MLDLEMVLFEDASATAVTSNVVDFGQKVTTSAMYACFTGKLAGTGNVTINIQESDVKAGTFATVASLVVPADKLAPMAVVGLPVAHKQFVKATVSVASGVTGTMTGYISNTFALPPLAKPEGNSILPTVD